MRFSVTSGRSHDGFFFRFALAVGLFAAFGWFAACSSDVKQAGTGTTRATGSTGDTTGASTTGASTTGSTTGDTTSGTPTGSSTGTGDTITSGGPTTTSGAGGDPTGGAGGGGVGGSGMGGAAGSIPPPPPSSRVDTNIDAGWKFNKADVTGAEAVAFVDTAWTTLNLPHTWNNMDGQDGPLTTPAYYRGIGWYRKHYTPPAELMGKKIYLQFDAAAFIADVYVNGTKVGTHSGGFSIFRYDVTAGMKVGMDNVIAVRVDNSQAVTSTYNVVPGASTANISPRSGDFTFFGGLYRDVHVLATDNLAISPMDMGSSGVYLTPSNVTATSADLSVKVKLSNGGAAAKTASVDVNIVDAAGMPVQTLSTMQSVPAGGVADAVITGKVMSPHLWNGLADPYVYHANVVVKDGTTVTDAVQQPLGFRSFAFNANTGFTLNGKAYPLHGVCMHQDHMNKGWAYSPPDIDNDFALIKEVGANCVRFPHYEHPQYTYEKADQLGIVGWAEDGVVDSINDTPEFLALAKQQLQELIRQSYNHPSLFIWGMSNEILLRPSTPATANTLAFVQALNTLGHAEDPSRITVNSCANNNQDDPINFVTDLNAFNTYDGWYYSRIADFATWADAKHANYPTKIIAVSEYGAGASIKQHGLPILETGTNRTDSVQTEEYATIFHEQHWAMISTRPFLAWTTIWNMFDFASDYRNEGLVPGLNTKGMITYDRQTKKDMFFLYKANWSKEPFVHINYRRFTTMPKSATEIRVYSNQPMVDLKLNGTSLGPKQAANHVFVWTGVQWAAGANVVDATAGTLTDRVTWTN